MVKSNMPSREEWLAELQRLNDMRSDEGMTTQEIMYATGHSVRWVSEKLNRALHEGKLIVGHATRPTRDGKMCTKPVYRLVEASADKKKRREKVNQKSRI